MPVRSIAAGETLGLTRGEVAIWITRPADGQALESVLAHTDPAVPVLAHDGDVPAAAHPADVVVLDPGCVVGPGWLDGLREAAYCDGNVATASAVSAPSPSLGLRPRIERPADGCVYVRRSAIDLAGAPDEPGFAARCLGAGLVHVLADDVAVTGVSQDLTGDEEPLRRALGAARRAAAGLSLVIDARSPDPQATGTQRHVVELVAALQRAGQEQITVVGSADVPGVPVIGESEAMRIPADVVHRPLQVFGHWELTTLARMAARTVITNHDLIAYRNPTYLPSRDAWLAYRRDTRLVLALADHVVFPSAHARDDALTEALVDPTRASVIANGVDHHGVADPVAPAALASSEPFVLCLGADYRHKNRVFALRVAQHLDARLVFAGPSVEHGSSAAEEAAVLAEDPALAARVVDLGAVTAAQRDWLLAHAALVLYPSVYEGFGFIPFEAAQAGVPCMWAPTTSLVELLGPDEAPIVMWDAQATATRAVALIKDPRAARANVDRVKAAGAALTWDHAARQLLDLYTRVCDAPPSPASTYAALGADAAVSEDGLRLVGRDGALSAEVQRPLLALATHPRIGGPVFGALTTGYRLARRIGGRRSRRT